MTPIRVPQTTHTGAPPAHTRTFALLGNPVSHSLSPIFQNAAFQAASCDAVYIAQRCESADVTAMIRALTRAGGGGNVTVPHKEVAVGAIEVPSDALTRTGACNTFWIEDGRIHGDNTDVEGVRAALRCVRAEVRDGRALVIGAGGAAAAVLCALLDAGYARIDLHNRTFARADALARRIDPTSDRIVAEPAPAAPAPAPAPAEPAPAAAPRYDVIINATSIGSADTGGLPIDLQRMQTPGAVIDVVYTHGGTALVAAATTLGIPATDGREMLIAQGAAAFERWFKCPAPIDVMRRAIGLE